MSFRTRALARAVNTYKRAENAAKNARELGSGLREKHQQQTRLMAESTPVVRSKKAKTSHMPEVPRSGPKQKKTTSNHRVD